METRDDLLAYRVEGIIAELSNYFEIRYEQLTRIKQGLESMHSDLLWQQMRKVREVLAGEKMFGPIRLKVADILSSRDDVKRRALTSPLDQTSIMSELIPEQEEGARRPGFVSVRSMLAFYTSVDPSLGRVIELTDIWLWWDVLDAADIFNFKEQKKLVEKLKGAEITKPLQDHYHHAMGRRDDNPISREEILTFEFNYLESVWKSFAFRRSEEKSYMMILKRDAIGGDNSVDETIMRLGSHVSTRRRLAESGLDDRLREYYAKIFKCDASKVTAEQAIAHEDTVIMRMREDLRLGLGKGAVLGEAYDYKKWQTEQMARDIKHFRQTIALAEMPAIEAPKAAAMAAAAAAAGVDIAPELRTSKPAAAKAEEPAEEEPILF